MTQAAKINDQQADILRFVLNAGVGAAAADLEGEIVNRNPFKGRWGAADTEHLTVNACQATMRRLADRGLLESRKDGRALRYWITDAGRDALAAHDTTTRTT